MKKALPERSSLRLTTDEATLVAAGAALLLIQYVAARELSSTLFSTELVVIGATFVTLLGPSVGYALSGRVRTRGRLAGWGAAALLIQLVLPVAARALTGALCDATGTSLTAALLLGGGLIVLCGFYATLLPLRAEKVALPRLYVCELLGALLALLLIRLCPSWQLTLWAYYALAAAAAHLLLRRAVLTVLVAGLALAAVVFYPRLDGQAARLYYARCRGHAAPTVLATVYSPYQRIDVVQDAAKGDATPPQRTLYLDGVTHFQSGELTLFPQLLAQLPGRLLPARGPALVAGSGSFSAAGHLQRLGYDVTVVELDEKVAQLGFAHFAAAHKLRPGQVRVVIDDIRRFLAHAKEHYQLIVLDVPAPYHLQTALLHTATFYRLVAAHLLPGGAAALSLCDDLDGPVGSSIAAAAAQSFAELQVVESEALGLSVLYASAQGALPFSVAATAAALAEYDSLGGQVYGDATTRSILRTAEPLSEYDLSGVLALSRQSLPLPRSRSD